MRTRLLFSFLLFFCLHFTATATSTSVSFTVNGISSDLALEDQELLDFPIFGKKKTSNKKQLKFAAKRSRRNGRGVMKARKRRGSNNGKSVRGGSRAKRGSKKKAGCNT